MGLELDLRGCGLHWKFQLYPEGKKKPMKGFYEEG